MCSGPSRPNKNECHSLWPIVHRTLFEPSLVKEQHFSLVFEHCKRDKGNVSIEAPREVSSISHSTCGTIRVLEVPNEHAVGKVWTMSKELGVEGKGPDDMYV